jgi:assimilatory nitrate reductase catalytic subunit
MATTTIRTTCSYCSVGCNFTATVEDGKVLSWTPDKEYPVNQGRSCPKGFNLLEPFHADDRLKTPLLRGEDGELHPVSWETAFGEFAARFKDVLDTHGPESAAFLSTGQIPMEEMAFLGALGKFGMGMVHGDGNTRQCMATAAVAYKQAFGFDAPPFTYTDIEESDFLVFLGSNAMISHPVLWNRLKNNRKEKKVVVIDPRATKTARAGDQHIRINPKGDLSFLYAVTNEIISNGWVDREYVDAHATGFAELADHASAFTPENVEAVTGLQAEMIRTFAREFHEAEAATFWWTMGVNQSHQGVRTAQAMINLCVITGNIGRPGTGPNSITGQANAMGSRLYSNTTSLYAGMDFLNDDHRRRVAELLGIDVSRVPQQNSLPYHKILEKVESGEIKALWIIATNPGHSWIDRNTLFERLKRLEFLVVQDLYDTTETARVADLVLPAAGSGEKSGTFINSERRIGIVDKVIEPPGDARSDFDIFKGIAEAWGVGEIFARWETPEDVFRFLTRASEGRPCDITGITGYQMIRERGGIQWPYPADNPDDRVHRRLFENGRYFTDDGKVRLLTTEIVPVPEPTDDDYPFVLITGRGSTVQFHTQTRTGKVAMLRKSYPAEAYVEISPEDAERLGISDGDTVEVSSRRGRATVDAQVTDVMAPGQLFMPMHYEETNPLTFPAFDPYSFEPNYKWAAVALRGPINTAAGTSEAAGAVQTGAATTDSTREAIR